MKQSNIEIFCSQVELWLKWAKATYRKTQAHTHTQSETHMVQYSDTYNQDNQCGDLRKPDNQYSIVQLLNKQSQKQICKRRNHLRTQLFEGVSRTFGKHQNIKDNNTLNSANATNHYWKKPANQNILNINKKTINTMQQT